MERPPLLIVDGDNLAHRAYHSTPKSVRGRDGQPINAISGFFGMLASLWDQEAARGIFVAWDTLGVETYRHRIWPSYQAGRVFEPEIMEQLDVLPGVCRDFRFGVGKTPGYEADDLMASAAHLEVAAGGSCLLLTSDRDSYQLISERVTVLTPRRGVREIDRIGVPEVVERLGVLPEQVPDYKALAGDPSDRIPGARGIGPKGAASLLLRYGTLENALANLNRPAEAQQLFGFRDMVRLHDDLDVMLPAGPPDWAAGAAALRQLGADNLADRIARLAAAGRED